MFVELLMSAPVAVTVNPPTGFSATTITSTRIDLAWTNAAGGLQTEIYRNGSLFFTTSAGATSYSDSAIGAGLEYSYKIRHVSGGNLSVFTGTLVRSGSPPAPVQSDTSVTDDDVTVSWSQPATTQTAVRVYRDGVNVSGDLSAGATSYVDTSLANATYTYTVKNYNGVAESAASNSKSAIVDYNPPLTDPSSFTATATHSDRVALAWTNGDGTAQTEIYRSLDGSTGWTLVTTTSTGATSYNDDDRNQTTAYYYRIRHVKGGSLSGYVTANATTPTTTISSSTFVADVGLDDIVLSWTLSNPPVTPVAWHGDYSDTLGEETASTTPGITSPRTVVTYLNGIVTKGSGTDCTGTLTYLRIYASNGTTLLAELTNLTTNFDVGAS